MHVIKVRGDKGEERIYVAKLLERNAEALTFDFKGEALKVAVEDLLDMVRVAEDRLH